MLKVETKELPINEELKKKLEIICSFANVKDYEIISGSIISIKKTNIAYIKPNILKVNGNDYLIVNDSDDVFINGYNERIKLKDLAEYIKNN